MIQLGVCDIRELGYKKILNAFIPDILKVIQQANTDAYNISCKAYGLPNLWGSLDLDDWYVGMVSFMRSCDPMVTNLSSSDLVPVKRTFRNRWTSLGKALEKDLGWSEQDVQVFLDFGIRMCFISRCEVSQVVVRFYNAILIWFVNTQYESGLWAKGYSVRSLLSALCLWSPEEFVSILVKEWK